MKLTEAEAITKLSHVGLPVHGTYDELIERLRRNGFLEEAKDIHNAAIAQNGVQEVKDEAKTLTSGPDNGFENALSGLVDGIREQERNAEATFNERPDVKAVMGEHPKRGRPRQS